MRVASDQLRIGDRLTESIYLHTDHPIVEAGKKIGTDELRRIQRFLIKEVVIEDRPDLIESEEAQTETVAAHTENPFEA